MKTMVALNDIVRVYGKGSTQVQALRGLNMEVAEGELTVVMGPSGSGKTTLLNIIGGMDVPTAGIVRVDNVTVNDMTESDLDNYRLEKIGFVFQTYNLIPALTAMKNVELPLLAAGCSSNEAHTRAAELFQIVGLEDRMDHRPNELSGGENQRVAIAAALANDPPVILADEPTGNLDTKTAETIIDYIKSITRDLNKTVILVTHDDAVARKADWIHIIRDGIISTRIKPSQLDEAVTSYDEFIRTRIDQVSSEIQMIDSKMQKGLIEGNDYIEGRGNLAKTIEVLREELAKLGQI
ncbi:MAG: ABC transporter ATP-binding protein [Candidatus Thorarchaeota archaeon]